jgi:hypothetical protein
MADINIILDAAPVQAVNGKIGFVTLSPQDIGITGLATSGDLSVLQNQIDNLDLNYASDLQLSQTGQNLQSQINSLGNTYVTRTSGQFTNRPFVNGTGVLLSGEAARLPDTIVYTSGSQIISGSKTFYADNYIFSGANVIFVQNTGIVSGEWRFSNRPTVNNTGVLLQGELDLSVYATVTNLATTGSTLASNLATTGSNLESQITGKANLVHTHVAADVTNLGTAATRNVGTASNEVSPGNHTHVATDITNSTSAGRTLLTSNLSNQRSHLDFFPILPSRSSFPITGDINRVYTALDTAKIYAWISLLNDYVEISPTQSGELDTRYALITNLANTGSTLSANINTTGNTLSNKIDTLSGNSVLTNGEQTIFGTKYFSNAVYISDLYVTGTEFIANVENKFIESPYILLNLTGGAVDGGLFFVTGSGLTGVNDYGPIIGFDHSNKFKFGIARRSDDLSILNDIASVQELNLLSGNLNTLTTNLATTGSTLNTKVDNLSGYINSTASNIIFTTGNQIKSGRLIIGDDAISIVDPNSPYTLSLQTNSPATWLEILNNSGGNQGVFFGIQDNDFEQYNWQGGDIRFFTSENPGDGTERLIIKNDGKIGIDTHSPSEKLEVAGNIKASGASFNGEIIFKDNLLYISQSSGQISGSGYTGYYDGGQFLGRTKLSQNNIKLVNVGEKWTARDSNRLWKSISMSSDGKYQSATVSNNGKIYISSDYGKTWTAKDSNRLWTDIVVSSDGKYQSAITQYGISSAAGKIYISNDYGNTWVDKISAYWANIAMSSDGKYQSAVDVYSIYISSDYGNTWVNNPIYDNNPWIGIAISSDGKYQTATTSNGQIYTSYDYGNTWIARDSNRDWRNVSISSDGKYQSSIVLDGKIYISSDYGVNWKPKESNRAWGDITMSSDGKYQSAVVFDGGLSSNDNKIYISNDYGHTWTAKESNRNWVSVSMSSDGKYQTAVDNGGQIYTSVADELIDGSFAVSGDGSFAGNIQASGASFNTRPTVNESGVLLQGELDLSVYATVTNLATTGSTLQSSVNTLTTNLATTGSTLQGQVNNRVTNLGGASGMRVLTTGEYNSLTPISGVLYILI